MLSQNTLDNYRIIKQEFQRNILRKPFREFISPKHHEKKAIFIHIPKAAGNSVTQSIYGCPSLEVGGHRKASQYQNTSRKLFRKYFVFAFVRNPFDRFYSAFNYLSKGGKPGHDDEFCEKHRLDKKTFNEFCLALRDERYLEEITAYVHFMPQYQFVCDEDQRVIVDRICRYENFEEEMSYICRIIGIEYEAHKINVTPGRRKPFTKHYSNETKAIVSEIYKSDLEMFGY